MKRPNVPKMIVLSTLAEMLNRRNDADFLLKEAKNRLQRNKRAQFIEGHLHDIVAGLARATQSCATEILNGDISKFAEVMAYELVKFRRLHPDAFLPGLKQQDEPSQKE